MAERLTDDAIDQGLQGTAWRREGDTIVRELELGDFAAAMAFVNAVAGLAEAANHHPDILIHGWNKVRLTLSTHSADGLTQSDLDLARGIDGLSASGRMG
jgi:4a-hydroxytetrahydrobiopterin dehydratase